MRSTTMKLNPHENTDNFMTASIFFVYPRIDPTLVRIENQNVSICTCIHNFNKDKDKYAFLEMYRFLLLWR